MLAQGGGEGQEVARLRIEGRELREQRQVFLEAGVVRGELLGDGGVHQVLLRREQQGLPQRVEGDRGAESERGLDARIRLAPHLVDHPAVQGREA